MSAKTAVMQFGLLRSILNASFANTSWATSGGSTAIWVGLHTGDPGEAASTAAEGGYTAYTRARTDRSTAGTSPYGWSVSSGSTAATAAPVGNVDFPQVATTSTGTFTHFTLWPSSAATSTQAYYYGSLSPSINFGQNTTPRITTSSSLTEA
jgi:hypothetical protein